MCFGHKDLLLSKEMPAVTFVAHPGGVLFCLLLFFVCCIRAETNSLPCSSRLAALTSNASLVLSDCRLDGGVTLEFSSSSFAPQACEHISVVITNSILQMIVWPSSCVRVFNVSLSIRNNSVVLGSLMKLYDVSTELVTLSVLNSTVNLTASEGCSQVVDLRPNSLHTSRRLTLLFVSTMFVLHPSGAWVPERCGSSSYSSVVEIHQFNHTLQELSITIDDCTLDVVSQKWIPFVSCIVPYVSNVSLVIQRSYFRTTLLPPSSVPAEYYVLGVGAYVSMQVAPNLTDVAVWTNVLWRVTELTIDLNASQAVDGMYEHATMGAFSVDSPRHTRLLLFEFTGVQMEVLTNTAFRFLHVSHLGDGSRVRFRSSSFSFRYAQKASNDLAFVVMRTLNVFNAAVEFVAVEVRADMSVFQEQELLLLSVSELFSSSVSLVDVRYRSVTLEQFPSPVFGGVSSSTYALLYLLKVEEHSVVQVVNVTFLVTYGSLSAFTAETIWGYLVTLRVIRASTVSIDRTAAVFLPREGVPVAKVLVATTGLVGLLPSSDGSMTTNVTNTLFRIQHVQWNGSQTLNLYFFGQAAGQTIVRNITVDLDSVELRTLSDSPNSPAGGATFFFFLSELQCPTTANSDVSIPTVHFRVLGCFHNGKGAALFSLFAATGNCALVMSATDVELRATGGAQRASAIQLPQATSLTRLRITLQNVRLAPRYLLSPFLPWASLSSSLRVTLRGCNWIGGFRATYSTVGAPPASLDLMESTCGFSRSYTASVSPTNEVPMPDPASSTPLTPVSLTDAVFAITVAGPLTSGAMGLSAIAGIQRVLYVAQLLNCGTVDEDKVPLSRSDSPTQLSLEPCGGSSGGQRLPMHCGAVVGNVSILLGVVFLMGLYTCGMHLVKKGKSSIRSILAQRGLPAKAVPVLSFLLQPTLASSLTLFRFSGSGTATSIGLGILGIVVCLSLTIAIIGLVRREQPLVKTVKKAPRVRVTTEGNSCLSAKRLALVKFTFAVMLTPWIVWIPEPKANPRIVASASPHDDSSSSSESDSNDNDDPQATQRLHKKEEKRAAKRKRDRFTTATEFLAMWGSLFSKYRRPRYWFYVTALLSSVVVAILQGGVPRSAVGCAAQSWLSLVLSVVCLLLVVWLRPFASKFLHWWTMVQEVVSVVAVVCLLAKSETGVLFCVKLQLVLGAFGGFLTVAKIVYAHVLKKQKEARVTAAKQAADLAKRDLFLLLQMMQGPPESQRVLQFRVQQLVSFVCERQQQRNVNEGSFTTTASMSTKGANNASFRSDL